MGVGVASSTKAFLRTHNNHMVSPEVQVFHFYFLLRTSFRTSLNLNIKPSLEKFPCTLGILPCTWLQVVQDTIVWCYHISAHNYHCPHSYQIKNKMMHHICLLTTNWNTTHMTIYAIIKSFQISRKTYITDLCILEFHIIKIYPKHQIFQT